MKQMTFGCIGRTLKHSFSREIHARLSKDAYELVELTEEQLPAFLQAGAFCGINVTIPYKQAVIPYLSEIDEGAAAVGAVNTIIRRDGRLLGYNTDVYGMTELLHHAGISLKDKKVLILGTGGTSKCALTVARLLGAAQVLRVSRAGREDAITYEQAYTDHTDARVIINTTPCGMYPNADACPIDIDRFPALQGVIDAIYNPLRTPLILSAAERGIAAEGGLYMLVAQGVRASEIFRDVRYPADTTERIYRALLADKRSIVLIGMPGCGKSTVGRALAERLGRPFIDTDECIVSRSGQPISDIFKTEGEDAFRDIEQQIIAEVSAVGGAVIATGGGAVLRAANRRALRSNGHLYFLDRPIECLLPTPDRPLALDEQAMHRRFTERYTLYRDTADACIDASGDIASVIAHIEGDLKQ